jgi:hypothetical protein
MEAVRKKLEQMILTDAPAAEFENELRDFPEKTGLSLGLPRLPDPKIQSNAAARDQYQLSRHHPQSSDFRIFPGKDTRPSPDGSISSGRKKICERQSAALEKAHAGMTPEVARFVSTRLKQNFNSGE